MDHLVPDNLPCLVNSREVPIGEDVVEAEVGVVCHAVDIIQTERILWLHKTVGVIEDFDPVGLEGVAGHLHILGSPGLCNRHILLFSH